jgi:superfamily II DNA or RNA helicase
MLRRTKAEVLPDLPPKRYQQIEVNGVDRALKAQLDSLWEEWQDVVAGGDLPPFEEFSKVRALLAESRTEAAVEWIEPYEDAGEPVVVFSAHRAPIDTLAAREGWASITGDTPAEKRTEIVARFQAGGFKGLACTIQAAGVGLTLTRASTALFIDLDWTPAINLQAQDRLHRIGQVAESVLYVRMTSTHPLDQHVQGLIARKMAMIERAVERLVDLDPKALKDEGKARELRERAHIEAEREEARGRCVEIARMQHDRLGAEAPELPLTAERVETIKEALAAMLAVCDGAIAEDGQGFNKPDAARSRWLAALGLNDEDAQRAALSMLQGYRRQLGGRFPALWE